MKVKFLALLRILMKPTWFHQLWLKLKLVPTNHVHHLMSQFSKWLATSSSDFMFLFVRPFSNLGAAQVWGHKEDVITSRRGRCFCKSEKIFQNYYQNFFYRINVQLGQRYSEFFVTYILPNTSVMFVFIHGLLNFTSKIIVYFAVYHIRNINRTSRRIKSP